MGAVLGKIHLLIYLKAHTDNSLGQSKSAGKVLSLIQGKLEASVVPIGLSEGSACSLQLPEKHSEVHSYS